MKRRHTLPPGLQHIAISFEFARREIRYDALTAKLSQFKGFKSKDGTRVEVVVPSGSAWSGCHGHLILDRPRKRRGRIAIHLEIYRGSCGPGKSIASLSKVGGVIASYLLAPDHPVQGSLLANFGLNLKEWRPAIPLPYSAPGETAAALGSPEIAGVVFDFTSKAQQPLRRASLEVFSPASILSVRLLLRQTAAITDELPVQIVEQAQDILGRFANRVPEGGGGN
jgi:hypothetical protein